MAFLKFQWIPCFVSRLTLSHFDDKPVDTPPFEPKKEKEEENIGTTLTVSKIV